MPSADQVADGAKTIVKKKVKKVLKKKKDVNKIEKKIEEKSPQLEIKEEKDQTEIETKVNDKKEPERAKSQSVILERPGDVATSEGEAVVVRVYLASVSSILGGSLKVTWIKGKWNELTKGDRYEMWCKEQHPNGVEHFLKFRQPKKSDTGTYRVKVVSPNGEEENSFNVKVAPAKVEEKKLEIIKKRKLPEERNDQKDMNFRNRLKKVERSRRGEGSGKTDVWSFLRSAKTQRDYESIAFKFGITDMRSMLRRVNRLNKTAGKNLVKSKAFYRRLPETCTVNPGEKVVFEVEVTNDKMTVKWEKDGVELTADDEGYQIINKGSKRCLVIDSATTTKDNVSFTCAVGSDVTTCEVFVQAPQTAVLKCFDDVEAFCGDSVCFQCQISNEDGSFKTLKDGSHILFTDRVKLKQTGQLIEIKIDEVELGDEGFYQLVANGGSTCAELIVREEQDRSSSNSEGGNRPSDLKVNVDEQAEIFCEVNQECDMGLWIKDDMPLEMEKERFKMIQDGKERKLVISQVRDSDCGEYSYVMTSPEKDDEKVRSPTCNIGACLSPSSIPNMSNPFQVTIEKDNNEPARIFLDCCDTIELITVKAGSQLKLEFPKPEGSKVTWRKSEQLIAGGQQPNDGDEQKATRFRSLADVKGKQAVLIIERTQIDDTGEYTIAINDESAETTVTSTVMVKVVDLPSAPSKPAISEITPETCLVTWQPSVNAEETEIKGYIVERRKTGSERWIRLNVEPHSDTEFEARRLIEGVEYEIRVRGCNGVGVGPPSQPSQPFTPLGTCDPPSKFRVISATDNSISLSWRAPNETSMSGIEGYRLEMATCKKSSGDEESPAEEDEWKCAVEDLLPAQSERTTVDGLITGNKYKFRLAAINKAGPSSFVEIQPTVCASVVEPPKILLPRYLTKPISVQAGDKMHINIPFQGRPKPTIRWLRSGNPLTDRVTVRNSLDSTVLFVRNAELTDSGEYVMELRVGDDEVVTASLQVNVIDVPSKPIGVKLVEVIETSAHLTWEPPSDCGNTDILGYIVEKRDARCDIWYVVNDKLRHTRCQVYDLVLGNSYYFQVRAFNQVGTSEATVLKEAAVVPKEKTSYKRPEYRTFDQRVKPEFTQPLKERRIMENYNGTLSCALKCNPRPKIRWYKNKVEIIDNPKYKMSHEMGIVQLEIRRARIGDAGNYTVVASNELGEDSTSAQVTVKDKKAQG